MSLFISLLLGACKAPTSTVVPTPAPTEEVEKSQLIILLKERIRPQMLEEEMSEYSLKAKAQTSRSQNLWIFTYDTHKIEAKTLLIKIKAVDYVLSAEFVRVKH